MIKTFKQYLNEFAADADSKTLLATMQRDFEYYIPIIDTWFSDIVGEQPTVTAFHICNLSGFERLVQNENTSTTISTSTRVSPVLIKNGVVAGNSGLCAKLTGKALLAYKYDLYSVLGSNGRRYILLNKLAEILDDNHGHTGWLGNNFKSAWTEIITPVLQRYCQILDVTFVTISTFCLQDFLKKLIEADDELQYAFLRDYLEAAEELLEKYTDELRSAIYKIPAKADKYGYTDDFDYNEVLVNQYKILSVLITNGRDVSVYKTLNYSYPIIDASEDETKVNGFLEHKRHKSFLDFLAEGKIQAQDLLISRKGVFQAFIDITSGRLSHTAGPLDVWNLEDGRLMVVDGYHRFVQGLLKGKLEFDTEIVGTGYSDYWATVRDPFVVQPSMQYGGLEDLTGFDIEMKSKDRAFRDFISS